MRLSILLAFLVIYMSSCSVLRRAEDKQLTNGYYCANMSNKKTIVYVETEDDILNVHPTQKQGKNKIVDTSFIQYFSKKEIETAKSTGIRFSKSSFDLDLLTVPVKFRPAAKNVPAQLSTNINGSIYAGYRNDHYMIRYKKGKLKRSDRTINHYGCSLGIFTGLGGALIDATTTDNRVPLEYNGVVWTKGITAMMVINNYIVGLSLGTDNLLDKNNTNWIYQSKPWLGLALGINLN